MGDIKIGRVVLGMVSTNCYFVYDEDTRKTLVFDPADEGLRIAKAMKQNELEVVGILLTHGHFDHITGANELRSATSAKIYAYKEEQEVCESTRLNCSEQVDNLVTIKVNKYLEDGEELELCGLKCKLIATPGHTQGSCCYYFENDGILISGDTLFNSSVGRSDLPTGSGGTLIRSIKDKLMVLPDDVKVYPGHGDMTTIGDERRYNPFL